MDADYINHNRAELPDGTVRAIWQFNEVQLGYRGPIITEETFVRICCELDKDPSEVTPAEALATAVYANLSI